MSTAEALRRGDAQAAARLARRLIKPFNNNLVPRPWGGTRMFDYKGVQAESAGLPPGEAFEIAAFDADEEAERYPSVIGFEDGSMLELPELLTANAEAILGPDFVARYGACVPLLPKTLAAFAAGEIEPRPQDPDAGTYYRWPDSAAFDRLRERGHALLSWRQLWRILATDPDGTVPSGESTP